jgi:hypothetical protein
MPLTHGYGVVVGTFASFTRDNPDNFGHWYHGKLRINTPNGQYEAALDVDTPSGVGVSYRLVTDLTTASIPRLTALTNGFTPLASTQTSGALDYVRSPVLADGWVVARLRRYLAGRRNARDLELWAPTRLDALLRLRYWPFWRWLRWRSYPWVSSNGENALNLLEPLLQQSVRLYVLGEPYTSGLGVHNVHMNQGDPPGPHQGDDGVWQDGAVICQDSTGAIKIWQIKFNTQSLNTGPTGLPI